MDISAPDAAPDADAKQLFSFSSVPAAAVSLHLSHFQVQGLINRQPMEYDSSLLVSGTGLIWQWQFSLSFLSLDQRN